MSTNIKFTTYVCDTESSQVVALEFAAHPLACCARTALSQMRGHVASTRSTKTASSLCTTLYRSHVHRCGVLASGRHGVLEGTLGGEMVSGTDTTLDLHLLERIGLLVLLGCLFLGAAGLEADRGLEHDVLTECGGVSRACGLAGLLANLGPCPALSDARVLLLLDDGAADALGALYFFAVLVDENGDDSLSAVLVLGHLGCGNGGGEIGLTVFGPVDGFLCVCCHVCGCVCGESSQGGCWRVLTVKKPCPARVLRHI